MDPATLGRALDDVFDHALVYHAFTDYMRDYEVIVHLTADPRTGIAPTTLRYLFRYCVEARCRTSVPPVTWRASLDDRLIDHRTGIDLDGYVWGVKWHALYPGARVVADSATARSWAEATGLDFHEVVIETNAHVLTLVFSDLQVSELPPGFSPFTVDRDG
ncbi:HalD/BesD family halogenase [Micromonospora sp. WMMD708]|uniref:YxiG-like protein n=1 Tax=Micromonospora sp. WMMD708 TaxID=3403464 RepID=UPI003BF48B0B